MGGQCQAHPTKQLHMRPVLPASLVLPVNGSVCVLPLNPTSNMSDMAAAHVINSDVDIHWA